MDTKKRRSSLRKSTTADMGATNIKTQLKRRISFSGRNSVRVFHGEEEPKTWNNSYEISDHLNGNETELVFCEQSSKEILSVEKKEIEHKKTGVDSDIAHKMFQIQYNHKKENHTNQYISKDISVLSSTKDMINTTYQQCTEMPPIENSVEITLFENEKFQGERVKNSDQTANNPCSFSIEDYEREDSSIGPNELPSNIKQNNTSVNDFKNEKGVAITNECINEDQDFASYKCSNPVEPITVYMNDSLSIRRNETNLDKNTRKSISLATTMQISPNKKPLYDKENVNPLSTLNANKTQNKCWQMDIEEESTAFQDKVNQLCLLQEEPDDDMQICDSLICEEFESRPAIIFKEGIENNLADNKTKLRPTIYFDQQIETSPLITNKKSGENILLQNIKSRPTINFNKTIELTPTHQPNKKSDQKNIFTYNVKSQLSIDCNQPMEVDIQTPTVGESNRHVVIPKVKSRPTINFNQTIDTSPPKVENENLIEEMQVSSVKLTQEPISNYNLYVSNSKDKDHQKPKVVIRRICTPIANRSKNPIDLEQQKLLRYKKKQEVDSPNKATNIAIEKLKKAEKSLNFSLGSEKNMSLSPESPLIPLEFEGYNLKQLNDEIECGKIKVFPNAQRKGRVDEQNLHSKNVQLTQSSGKQRKTMHFENVDMNLSFDETVQNFKTDFFDFNTTKDVFTKEDDIMLDNTTFLTRAKLSDETLSRHSSKMDLTQMRNISNIFEKSRMEVAESKIEKYIVGSSSDIKNSGSKKNDTASPRMDISNEIEHQYSHENINLPQRLAIHTEESKTQLNETIEFNNDVGNDLKDFKRSEVRNEIINPDKSIQNSAELETTSTRFETNVHAEKSDKKHYNSIPARKTLYFNDEISLENELMPIVQKNIQVESSDKCINNSASGKTLFFNDEILPQKTTTPIEESVQMDLTDTEINFTNTLRKTLCANDEIPLEKESIIVERMSLEKELTKIEENCPVENAELQVDICDVNLKSKDMKVKRNTVYFNNDITLENQFVSINQERIQDERFNTDAKNSRATRKTLYFENEICDSDETLQSIGKEVSKIKVQVNDVTVGEYISEIASRSDYPCPNKEQSMELTLDTNSKGKTIDSPRRKTIYTDECLDLTLVGEEQNKNAISADATEYENGQNILPTESDQTSLYANTNNDKRNTVSYEDYKDMSLEQSFKPAENVEIHEPRESLTVAKPTLAHKISINSLASISKLTNKHNSLLITPVKCIRYPSVYMTPRLSLLEFTTWEEKTEKDHLRSSVRTGATNKRLTYNLTPVLSKPKKQQTLTFDDRLLGDIEMPLPLDQRVEQIKTPEKPSDVEQTNEMEESVYINKCVTNDDAMILSGIIPNESVAQQTPPKERKSRIPIPPSSAKNNNKIFSFTGTSNNYKEDMECDNLGESIQLMRRATFTITNDTTKKRHDLKAEVVPFIKPSIYEGNPITISDVSIFYEAQRKSNIANPPTEMSLAFDKTDTSVLNPIEIPERVLENRYINLTLEDIDKTRLSLVQSYQDSSNENLSGVKIEDNAIEELSPRKDEVISEKLENKSNSSPKLRKGSYLRNASLVCRRCKRCQETLINETSSSISESFSFPELPPIPDIGLDRLKRLRKLPTIGDVNALWQRVSLDRTIVNALSISVNDSQNIYDLDDEPEAKNSPITKFIQKYENDMMRLEMDILEKQQNIPSAKVLPFVSRLNALLRTSSTNWIFDHQMQYRGILLFTHREMLTFKLSLIFDEVDPLGSEINLISVKLEKHHVPTKNWRPIDYVLDFQLKLNLPFNLQWLCKGSNETDILKMLQEIDRVCLDTVKMGNCLQRISLSNQASIIRDECRTYVRKIVRKVVNSPNGDFKYVEKTEIKIELLNLRKMSFKNIVSPRLHHFREEIHLLPTGLDFLQEFLPNPLKYLKDH